MSGMNAFLKQNKKNETKNTLFPASAAFVDEKGEPIMWEIKAIKSKEAEQARTECNKVVGKKIITDNAKWNRLLASKCTVFPNLNDAELQDSYGVMSAEDLITELLDNDGEYQAYVTKVFEVCGYAKKDEELKEEVKN